MHEKQVRTVWETSGFLMEAPTISGAFLFAVDILGQKLFRLNKFNGQRYEFDLSIQITSLACPDWRWHSVIQQAQSVNANSERTVLLGTGPKGVCVLHIDPHSIEIIEVTQMKLPETVRFNDGKMAPDGVFYAGTMDKNESDGVGALYAFLPNGEVKRIAEDIVILNGPCFGSGGNRMLYADSAKGIVYDARQGDNGSWHLHDHFVEISSEIGAPDGMTFDQNDSVWIAVWGSGAVFQFDSTGTIVDQVDVDLKLVTSVCHDIETGQFYVTGQNDLSGTGAIKEITFSE